MNNITEAIIEIPLGTRNKYEIDKKRNRIKLDRVQYSSMTYPSEYGFVEDTLALDGDPIDILVITGEPTFPGCIVESRILGFLDTIDKGFKDPKLIAVNNVDPRYNQYQTLNDLPSHSLMEIKNFFENYKTLQNIKVEVFEYHEMNEALEILREAKERYQANN